MSNIWSEVKRMYFNNNILTRLIIINLAVFVVINILHVILFLFSSDPLSVAFTMLNVQNWFSVPGAFKELATKPWSPITYMFLHKDFLHLAFNMLWLFWFGRIFLSYLDEKKFIGVYLVGGLSGALVYMLAYNIFPAFSDYVNISIMMGASASVMAIVFAISFYVPDYRVNLLFIGPVKLKYIAIFSIVLDFLMIASSNAGGHIAHIGGAAFGFLFIEQFKKQKDITQWAWGLFYPNKNTKTRKKKNPNMHVSYKRPKNDMEYNKQKAEEQKDMNRILDKIAQSGYESLTKKEKELLFKLSDKN